MCKNFLRISPQISVKFQETSSKFLRNLRKINNLKLLRYLFIIFGENYLEFPRSFHMTLLPNINILKSCTTSFKNFKNFLKISVMFSAVLPKFVEKLPTIFLGFSSIF